MPDIKLALSITNEKTPEIQVQVSVDGYPIMDPQIITAELMTAVATKILAQGGKGVGKLINEDGSLGDLIKFTATKVETI